MGTAAQHSKGAVIPFVLGEVVPAAARAQLPQAEAIRQALATAHDARRFDTPDARNRASAAYDHLDHLVRADQAGNG